MNPLPAHLITVEADAAELARTQILVDVLKPLSSTTLASLDELTNHAARADAPTVVRLFGGAHTQVLTWMGPGGRVVADVAVLGFCDGIVTEVGHPSRAVGVLAQAFVSAVAADKLVYDATGAGILIGASDETRAMAASLSRLGFKRIMIVDADDRKTEQMAQVLRRRLFGVQIEPIARASLTQVPNESSMAINLVGASESSLLEDVSYLNFLKKKGVWIDWTLATTDLGFADEITNAGAHIFAADKIRAWRDVWLLNSVPGLVEQTGQKPEQLVSRLIEAWGAAAPPPSETDPS